MRMVLYVKNTGRDRLSGVSGTLSAALLGTGDLEVLNGIHHIRCQRRSDYLLRCYHLANFNIFL